MSSTCEEENILLYRRFQNHYIQKNDLYGGQKNILTRTDKKSMPVNRRSENSATYFIFRYKV